MENQVWHAGTLLEMSGYYWKTCTLHAAVKLDIFSLIGRGRFSAEALAKSLNADTDGLERLLNALSAMQLLSKNDEGYANTEASRQYLDLQSPDYLGWMIMHHHHLVQSWSQLDQAVASGSPVRASAAESSEKWRECFLRGMHTNARLQAPALVQSIDLSGRESLLDLGGGPGTYAIHFCRANPGLQSVVFDLPDSRPIAEANIQEAGLGERIRFQAGDYHKDSVDGRFDVVWLSHILHAEGPEACQKIVDLAVSALRPGGRILIHEFILADSKDAPEMPALFSLNMLVGTRSGRAYSEAELKELLTAAGVRQINRLDYRGPTASGILSGHVTA